MQHWNLTSLDVDPHRPTILHSKRDESRTILVNLPAGEKLDDHEVHERAHVLVVDGEVELSAGDGAQRGGPGLLAVFDPGERHAVSAIADSRVLLFLAPWPGNGHPGARDD